MSNNKGYYEILRSKNGEFYWRFKKNGRIIARSSETYKRYRSARASIVIMGNSGGCIVYNKTIKKKSKWPYHKKPSR